MQRLSQVTSQLQSRTLLPITQKQTAPQPNVSASARSSVCPQCDGTGYVRMDLPVSHPSFGRIVACPACSKRETAGGLNETERQIRLTDLETHGRPGALAMVQAAQEFIAGGRVGFLTIHGKYGNGKSTVLKAIVNDCIENRVDVRYVTMAEVMAYAREAFESETRGDTDYGRIARLATTPVLVIDELDKARLTEYVREVQSHLFDVRYRQSHLFGTVVAWNGSFESLDLPWVRSRLSQFPVVENTDTDMRPLLGGMA